MCSSSPILLTLLSLFLLVSPPGILNVAQISLKLNLVHIDSPESPHRRSYITPEHRLQEWEDISARRLTQIHNDLAAETETHIERAYHPNITLDRNGLFLAKLGVGSPPKVQLLVVDIGSSLTWVTCIYSKFQRGDYSFRSSKTNKMLLCGDQRCSWIKDNGCPKKNINDNCGFMIKYASSNEIVHGLAMSERFIFFHEDQSLIVDPIVFGCGFLDAPLFTNFMGTGVLGLSPRASSMASQLGESFSYCIGSIHDEGYKYNSLTLGIGNLLGTPTPIRKFQNHIFVNLQYIKVGGEILLIKSSVFEDYDTVMDTGATFTHLVDEAYTALRHKLIEMMKPDDVALCFRGIKYRQVPEVQLVFEGGAFLSLSTDALFVTKNHVDYCFEGIKPSSKKRSVIGINAQQNHNVGYDYGNNLMYVKKMSCESV